MKRMRNHDNFVKQYLLFLVIALFFVSLSSGWGYEMQHIWLDASIADASTGVTTSTGAVPAAAGSVFGSWDAIVTANVIPLGAVAVGLAAIFAGMRAGSGGLIGGGIIGLLAAILTTALPAIVTEGAAGADLGMFARVPSACLSTFTPMTLAIYAAVRYVRKRR